MKQTVLFTGHMIDAPGRKEPRFPAAKEGDAQEAIAALLHNEKRSTAGGLRGIAGGACGGDILFHETCLALGIPSEIYLALPVEKFREESVSFAGRDWEQRFDRLIRLLPVHVLPEANGLQKERSVWERANLWMLEEALAGGGGNLTLIALWDGKGGDGPGGTEHMVSVAEEQGANTQVINPKNL